MNKKFEEPMINVYNFKLHDITTTGLSDPTDGYEGGNTEGDYGLNNFYRSNYITVKGGLDENIPL